MSELKAMTVLNVQQMGCYDNALVYFKSEADKVIAKLENEIEEQKRLRDMALASVPNVLKVMKIIQHHKYKRCLGMAYKCMELCQKSKDLYRWAEDENLEHYYNRKIEFFARWNKRWLKLAKKFKEAK